MNNELKIRAQERSRPGRKPLFLPWAALSGCCAQQYYQNTGQRTHKVFFHRSAGSSFLTGVKHGYEKLTLDNSDKEGVVSVKFGRLLSLNSDGTESSHAILLLGYYVGFQVWSLRADVKELASRRDGKVRCLEPLPLPLEREQSRCPFLKSWPLIAVVYDAQKDVVQPGKEAFLPVSYVKLYSLQSHSYIHSIAVPGKVLSICCSRRVLLVAMSTQIMAYNLATMDVRYSAMTYPAPNIKQLGDKHAACTPVPLALGERWLAHASNQCVHGATGIAVARPVSATRNRAAPAGSSLEAVQHYATVAARTSGKHIKSIGEAGYQLFSSQVDQWRNGSSGSLPSSPSSTSTVQPDDTDVVGTIIVRDLVTRTAIVHFRAHTSPLLLLRFDGSGTLLVTASVYGHTVNVFHITPGGGGSAVHLFRLSRGMTPAFIQDVTFSNDGFLGVSSARGTTHIFHLSLPGAAQDVPTHLAAMSLPQEEKSKTSSVKLHPVGRARPAGLLNGSIPGSAAAAAAMNLYNGTSGVCLIASSFLPRPESEDGTSSLMPRGTSTEEDLYVATSDGFLVRHKLSWSRQHSEAAQQGSTVHDQQESLDDTALALTVEPVEQWDVCRRHSWPEREEALAECSQASRQEESLCQTWSAQAETCIPGRRSPPVWADSQFHILEMQTGGSTDTATPSQREQGDQEMGVCSRLLKLEEVPTKRINTQTKAGVAPVIIEGAETAVLRGAQLRASQKAVLH